MDKTGGLLLNVENKEATQMFTKPWWKLCSPRNYTQDTATTKS